MRRHIPLLLVTPSLNGPESVLADTAGIRLLPRLDAVATETVPVQRVLADRLGEPTRSHREPTGRSALMRRGLGSAVFHEPGRQDAPPLVVGGP